jgi:hypothetical protein
MSFAFCIALFAGPGCRAQQLASDQNKIRLEVLNLYTDQIMDNLIRTDQGLPIVQMDYTQLVGTVTQNGTTGITDGYTSTAAHSLAGIVQSISHTFSNVFTFNASGYETAVLSVTANPLINNNEVYNAYIKFVNQTPSPLLKTCDPPPPGAAHICRKCGSVYYWIPTDYKNEFFRLALATTVMRAAAPADYFENTVLQAVPEGDLIKLPPAPDGSIQWQQRFAVQFKTMMQNGTGVMNAVINGSVKPFPLHIYGPPSSGTAAKQAKTAAPSALTDWFFIFYSIKTPGGSPEAVEQQGRDVAAQMADLPRQLAQQPNNQPVKVTLDLFRPTPPAAQTLNTIQSDTTQIRLQGTAPH